MGVDIISVCDPCEKYGSGYIKIHRSIIDHRYFDNAALIKFYLWCIVKASWTDRKVMVGKQTVELKRGQFIFGREAASRELKQSVQITRSLLKILIADSKLNQQTTNRFSIITVINYDTWQDMQSLNNQHINQQITSKQPANNQQLTTNKNIKNKTYMIKPSDEDVMFCQFWQKYPRKVGKGAALAAWRKVSHLHEEILKALEWQCHSEDWVKDRGKYIPHPTTYLNQRRWEDEPQTLSLYRDNPMAGVR